MSVDPGVIRAQPHAEVGLLLQRDANILIERWSQRAIQEQPGAKRVHHQALVDHFREFLQAMGRSLAESDHVATLQHCLPATVHGEQRWETGWSLPEVIRDYQILQLVILDYLDEVLDAPPNVPLIMAIGLALDEAIAASVTVYVASRDEHFRTLEEERAQKDRQIQDHLRHRTETLHEVDRRKNEFMATLGHEMRNPLAPLSNAVYLLELHQTTDELVLQARDIVKRQVQHLARLADDLLDISRIAQGKIELCKEAVEIGAVVNDAVQMSKPHLDARNHNFEFTLPSRQLYVEGDPARLLQILVNLLNNAAKYTEPGGRVWLFVEEVEGQIEIRIRDTGVGIPQELLPHVFELFTQGEWTAEYSQGGIGIGLALVRRLVELHGGTIGAFSKGFGAGSEFLVKLPALASAATEKRAENTIAQTPASIDSKSQSRRILLVDDNVDAAKTLRMLLVLNRHEVQLAYDGATALQMAEEFRPDVILLDIGLPRMDGYEVARRLKANEHIKDTFLVAITGFGQAEDRERAMNAGFDAHLLKPVKLESLQAILSGKVNWSVYGRPSPA